MGHGTPISHLRANAGATKIAYMTYLMIKVLTNIVSFEQLSPDNVLKLFRRVCS